MRYTVCQNHYWHCCTYLANYDSRQISDLTHTKQFLWEVFTIIKFPVETDVHFFFFVQYVLFKIIWIWKLNLSSTRLWYAAKNTFFKLWWIASVAIDSTGFALPKMFLAWDYYTETGHSPAAPTNEPVGFPWWLARHCYVNEVLPHLPAARACCVPLLDSFQQLSVSRPIALGYSRGSMGVAERTGRNTHSLPPAWQRTTPLTKLLQLSAIRPWFLHQHGPKTQTDGARKLCGMVWPGAGCRSRRLYWYGAPSWFEWVGFQCCRGFGASAQEAQNLQTTQISVPWLRFRPENHHRLPRAHEEKTQQDRCQRCVELSKITTVYQ